MTFGYVVRPKADLDIDDIADYIASEAGLEVGIRFLSEVYRTFALVATQPGIGWHCRIDHPQLKLARTFRVGGRFKEYLVFYQPYKNRIELMRVLNGSQDLEALFSQDDALDQSPGK